jgi:cell division septation protein DedD
MPDLNLIEDEGLEESPKEKGKPAAKPGGGGGGATKILVIFFVVIIVLAATYLLNKKGIIKLWGHKKAQPAYVEEQQPEEQPYDSTVVTQEPVPDTASVETVEAPPVAPPSEKPAPPPKSEAETTPDIGTMKGAFTVRVFTYSNLKRAEVIVGRLQDAGYPAFIEKVKAKNKTLFAVCIGKYATQKEAKKAVKGFAEELQSSYAIEKVKK